MHDAIRQAGLLETIDAVRHQAAAWGASELSATFRTLDGECEIAYRPGDHLVVRFRGDGRERQHVLEPDWPHGAEND